MKFLISCHLSSLNFTHNSANWFLSISVCLDWRQPHGNELKQWTKSSHRKSWICFKIYGSTSSLPPTSMRRIEWRNLLSRLQQFDGSKFMLQMGKRWFLKLSYIIAQQRAYSEGRTISLVYKGAHIYKFFCQHWW